VIDVLGLLAVLGALAVLWIAMGMFETRRKTKKLFEALDAERERHVRSASADAAQARAERRSA
jgi:hypothetical protein